MEDAIEGYFSSWLLLSSDMKFNVIIADDCEESNLNVRCYHSLQPQLVVIIRDNVKHGTVMSLEIIFVGDIWQCLASAMMFLWDGYARLMTEGSIFHNN